MWDDGSAASDSPYLTLADSKSAARNSLLPSSFSLLPSSSLSDGDKESVFAVGDGGRSADVAEGDVGWDEPSPREETDGAGDADEDPSVSAMVGSCARGDTEARCCCVSRKSS